jgi:hypothetical protein
MEFRKYIDKHNLFYSVVILSLYEENILIFETPYTLLTANIYVVVPDTRHCNYD